MLQDRIVISLGLPELCVLSYEDTGEEHRIWAEKVRCVVFCAQCGSKEVHPTREEPLVFLHGKGSDSDLWPF